MIGITEVQALELVEGNLTAKGQSLQVTQVGSDRGQIKVVWKYNELYEGNTTLTFKMNGQEILYVNDEATQEGILFGEPSHRVSMSQAGPLSIVSRDVPNKRGTREITMTLRFSYSVAFDFSAVSEDRNVESLFGKFKVELTPGDLDPKPDSGGDSGSSGGGGSGGGGNNSGGDSGLPPDEGENEGGGNGEKPDTGGGGDIEWGEGDRSGYEMEWEHEAQSMTDKGRQKIWFYYPMSQGGTVSMTLVANGSEVLSFTDHVAEDGSLDIAPGTKTYSLTNSSGMLQVLDEKVYQKDKRRVLELEVRFMKGCLVRGEAHSTVPLGWPIATCSFNVSLVPGDEGDKNDGPLQVSVQDISSGTKRLTANYYGPIENYKYIIWKIHVDTNLNGKYEASEQLPSSRITFNSSYTEAVWLIYRQGNAWPGYNVNIRLSSEWEEGAQENPQYDPSKPSPDDPNGGGGGEVQVFQVIVKVPDDIESGELNGMSNVYKVYQGDTVPFEFIVSGTDKFTSSFKMHRMSLNGLLITWEDRDCSNDGDVHLSMSETSGSVSFDSSGIYMVEGTFTDDKGNVIIAQCIIRAYPHLTARLTDNSNSENPWTHPLYSTVWITSGSSSAVDIYSDPWATPDWSQDTWSVTPLDGQSLDSILALSEDGKTTVTGSKGTNAVHFGKVPLAGLDSSVYKGHRGLGFTESGRYQIEYTCTDTKNEKAKTKQIITVTGKATPTIQVSTGPLFYRDVSDGNVAKIKLNGPYSTAIGGNAITCTMPTRDSIKGLYLKLVYDSNNDGVFDESMDKVVTFDSPGTKEGFTWYYKSIKDAQYSCYYEAYIKTPKLGKYQLHLSCVTKASSDAFPLIPVEEEVSESVVLTTEVDNTAPSATYENFGKQKVDVAFATGKFSQKEQFNEYLETFEHRLNSAEHGLDTKIQEVESYKKVVDMNAADARTIFSQWEQYPNPNAYTLNGNALTNIIFADFGPVGSNPGYNQGFIEPDSWEAQDIVIAADMNVHSCGFLMGFVFRWNRELDQCYLVGTTGDGQTLLFKQTQVSSKWGPSFKDYQEHGADPTPWNKQLTPLVGGKGSDTPYGGDRVYNTDQHYRVEMKGDVISVWYNEELVLSYKDPNPIPSGGCGLYVGCCGSFLNVMIETEAESVKTLGEVVNDVSWRNGATRFIVHTADEVPEDFTNFSSDMFAYTLDKVLQTNAYVANLGTNVNRSQFERFGRMIREPSGLEKAVFFNNSPIVSTLQRTESWILDIMKRSRNTSQWYLVDDAIGWDTQYEDQNRDPALNAGSGWKSEDDLFAEKWRFTHTPSYFDNGLGTFPGSAQWITSAPTTFRHTGKYKINYKRKDNPLTPSINLEDLFSNYRYWSTNYDGTAIGTMLDAGALGYSGTQIVDTDVQVDSDVQKSKANRGLLRKFWSGIRPILVTDAMAADSYTSVVYDEGKDSFIFELLDKSGEYDVYVHSPQEGYKLGTLTPSKSKLTIKRSDIKSAKDYYTYPKVSKVTLESSNNDVSAKIKWDGGNGKKQIRFESKCVKGEGKSKGWGAVMWPEVPLDKDDKLEFKVTAGGSTDTTTSEEYKINRSKLRVDEEIVVQSWCAGEKTGSSSYTVKLSDIYFGKAVDDVVTIDEGQSIFIDVFKNDTKDLAFGFPITASIEVPEGGFTCVVRSLEDLTTGVDTSAFKGSFVLAVDSQAYSAGTYKIPVKFSILRSDIPALESTVTLTIRTTNKPPVTTDVTKEEVANTAKFESDKITIPTSLLIAHTADEDTPQNKLKVSRIHSNSAGNIALVGSNVEITQLAGLTGLLTFRYHVTDGLAESASAVVNVQIEKSKVMPVAISDSYSFDIAKVKGFFDVLSNDKANGYSLTLVELSPVTLNGIKTTIASAYLDYDDTVPRVGLELLNPEALQSGDRLSMTYTLAAVEDMTSRSQGTLNIALTGGIGEGTDVEGELYIHRMPSARFKVNVQKSSNRLTSARIASSDETSSDLDHSVMHRNWSSTVPYSWKGIRAWEWAFKLTTDESWQTSTFDAGSYSNNAQTARDEGIKWINNRLQQNVNSGSMNTGFGLVSLRVRDIDGDNNVGVWSNPYVTLVSAMNMRPVALFELSTSTFFVSESGSTFGTEFKIDDLSHSPCGNTIRFWEWTFTDNSDVSETIVTTDPTARIVNRVNAIFANPNYKNEKNKFKLSLKVKDSAGLESDVYNLGFFIYKKNQPPQVLVPDNSQLSTVDGSTLYEIDDGLDGVVGDDWGKASDITHRGKIDFSKLVQIKDDQLSSIKVDWLFSGQELPTRKDFRDKSPAFLEKLYAQLAHNAVPFTRTVTEEGFKPGVYKMSVTVTDNPDPVIFGPDSAMSTTFETRSKSAPYHLYVVPKIDMYPHYQFGDWIDGKINAKTGQTLAEAGLTPEDVAPCTGDFVTVYVDCNQYVTGVSGYRDLNGSGNKDAGDDMEMVLEKGSMNPDGTIRWSKEVELEEIPDPVGDEVLTKLKFGLQADTNWGSETGDVMRSKKKTMEMLALATKLYDFNVQYVTDPDVSEELPKRIQETAIRQQLGGMTVGDLAIDRNEQNGELPRKGYSFYFEVWSKGLSKENDWVRITPKFYALDVSNPDSPVLGSELTGYLQQKDKSWKSFQDKSNDELAQRYPLFYEGEKLNKLGSHAEMNLPISLRSIEGTSQRWKGRYGIPASARFAPAGVALTDSSEYKGDILVCFNFKAVKKGVERVDYVQRRQWAKERVAYNNPSKGFYVGLEETWKASGNFIGSVIVYDGLKSVEDEYSVSPTWNE